MRRVGDDLTGRRQEGGAVSAFGKDTSPMVDAQSIGPDDVIITLRPAAGGASTIEIDRLQDGSYRATHRAGLGSLELCRTDNLERLLRQLNEALVTGTRSGYVAAVRNLHDLEQIRRA